MTAVKRRWRIWLGLGLLLFVAASFLLPAVRWRVIGWVRGEAFYQGMPTSYWAKEVARLESEWCTDRWTFGYDRVGGLGFMPATVPSFWDEVKEAIGLGTSPQPPDPPAWQLLGKGNLVNPEALDAKLIKIRPRVDPVDPAGNAVLQGLAQDHNAFVRFVALRYVDGLHRAENASILTQALRDPDSDIRLLAALCLGKLGRVQDPAIVPTLIQGLKNNQSLYVQMLSADSLGTVGPAAKSAVPALIELIAAVKKDDPEGLVDTFAKPLKKIDPEAAAKAGVK
jgi:hypothetical protein